jgi:hypothetical protein
MISAYEYFNCPIETLTRKTEDNFFSGIRLANQTFKTTLSGRMRDVDEITIRLARERGWLSPAIMDVGVSSGATTIDLFDAMTSNGFVPAITATDLTIGATIFAVAPGMRVLEDSHGNSLQYELFGYGIRSWPRRLDFITGYSLLRRLARTLAAKRPKSPVMDVKLVSRLRTLAMTDKIKFLENDLANRSPEFDSRFDIVRAANVLNRSYFDSAKLRLMVDNLMAYARKPGGLIVINRTHDDGTNHGTFFEVATTGPRVVRRIRSGSEIESLLCASEPRETLYSRVSSTVATPIP